MFIIGVPYSNRRYGTRKKIQVFCFCDEFFSGAMGRAAGLQGWRMHRMGQEQVGPLHPKIAKAEGMLRFSGTAVSAYLIKIVPITVLL